MRQALTVILIFLYVLAGAQTTQTPEQIRQQMAKIRQTTDWNDAAAAKKANEEIKKLAGQLSGGKTVTLPGSGQQQAAGSKPASAGIKPEAVTKENILAIADRFYNRSYRELDAVTKSKFNSDLKSAADAEFSLKSVRELAGNGGVQLTFGTDHHIACVYIAAAVKAFPTDTLSVNNFGAYLRNIDSTALSIPVLLYANKLFSQSPLILTQLGNSYFELNDLVKAESYYKQALKINPDFGQAHSSLCDLYIKQNRMKEALLELFAGVKGMGFSYNQATNNFSQLKAQADNSPDNTTDKEKFWDETRNQMNPPDPLASLIPEVDRLKMPGFSTCSFVADWMEGGGYGTAIQAYQSFHGQVKQFNNEFNKVQFEKPNIGPNAVLRDYPNERFALDCIIEYFFRESKDESDDFRGAVEEIIEEVKEDMNAYFENAERIIKDYEKCREGCGTDNYCIEECKRVYCTSECPAANIFNKKLQGHYNDYLVEFNDTRENQKKILEDLYEFSGQWFSKIESPYWSRIYAYEIQRVALTVIGNAFMAYQQTFPVPVHNTCGTDCSVYANPYPLPPEKVEKKEPKPVPCPDIVKGKIGFGACDLSLDCESIEFGCAFGVAASVRRNFVKKTTAGFLGVGVKGSGGFISAGATAGYQVTVTDNNEVESFEAKSSISVSLGSGVTKLGASYSGTYSVMTGLKDNVGFSAGGKAK